LILKSTPVGPVTTGGAQIGVASAKLASLRIGNAGQCDVDVIVGGFLSMLSQAIGTKLDGIIGYNFLRRYKVVIDYPEELLSLFSP
jgi:hypothetical protein